MALELNDFEAFLGPNGTRYTCCHFRDHKSLDFQGPTPLTIALVMNIAFRVFGGKGVIVLLLPYLLLPTSEGERSFDCPIR
jgi:hypothetical protein